MKEFIKITPLGGVGEVGALNCMVYETEDEAIVVDCGSMFPDQDTLGVDMIIPDFTYLKKIEHKLKGLVLTHGHEDHIGSTAFLLKEMDIPVYGAPFTLELIKNKLEELPPPSTPKLHLFKPGETVKVGSFEIDTIFVNHSIIDASALVITTPYGPIVHLTDWKIDETPYDGPVIDLKKFAKVAKKGVLALLCDSTNATSRGSTLSETQVVNRVKKIIAAHKGRVLVTLFSSNIQRVQGLADIAKKTGRTLALLGRSMKENTEIARMLGQLSFEGIKVVDIEDTDQLPDDEVMVLVTGTQGEHRSALSRIAHNNFKPFKIKEGDLVLFSSKMIPGNEKNISTVINNLCKQKAKVLYESAYDIHTSGHAHQDELKRIYKILKPQYYLPIHGDYRHLVKHGELAVDWGHKKEKVIITENGNPIVFNKKGFERAEKETTGRVFVDGTGVGDVASLVLRDRFHLSDTGVVVCILSIDRQNGNILNGPDLIARGVIEESEQETLFNDAKKEVLSVVESFNTETRTDMAEMQEEVRVTLRRFFNRNIGRKPMVIPVIQEV
ncbi:ribonuclease J [bacterium]|nr:ribonuclease J [bacterium]